MMIIVKLFLNSFLTETKKTMGNYSFQGIWTLDRLFFLVLECPCTYCPFCKVHSLHIGNEDMLINCIDLPSSITVLQVLSHSGWWLKTVLVVRYKMGNFGCNNFHSGHLLAVKECWELSVIQGGISDSLSFNNPCFSVLVSQKIIQQFVFLKMY